MSGKDLYCMPKFINRLFAAICAKYLSCLGYLAT